MLGMGKTSNKKLILGIMIAAVFILGILTIDFASANHPQNAGYRFTQFVEDLASHFPVTSADIVDGTIQGVDIATDAVGSTEIADNAVGGSEIAGTSKLLFGKCSVNVPILSAGAGLERSCLAPGASSFDEVVVTMESGLFCWELLSASTTLNAIIIVVRNDCSSATVSASIMTIGYIIYNVP